MMTGEGTHKTAESDFSAALGSRRIAAVTLRMRIEQTGVELDAGEERGGGGKKGGE